LLSAALATSGQLSNALGVIAGLLIVAMDIVVASKLAIIQVLALPLAV
jgi:hypothetical protein